MRRLPAEWEPQSATLLTWPHTASDWSDILQEADAAYTEIVATILRFQPVILVCFDQSHRQQIQRRLNAQGVDLTHASLVITKTNDTWVRDYGPITILHNDQSLLLDFHFNAWGGKFAAELDDACNQNLATQGLFAGLPMQSSSLTLEGGAIECDGQGTLMMVERTLLDPARNPGRSKQAIEEQLRRSLGARRFLWLEQGGLSGDDTDGHIDTLARFCTPDRICYQQCLDPNDPDFLALQAMEAELHNLRQLDGAPYELIPLPHPGPVYDPQSGRRLPASYANFLLLNGAVLLPIYKVAADSLAMQQLACCFPDRKVVGVDCRTLIRQNGSLHCATMQLPAAVAPAAPE
ncbi:agmatine deiminase family protein [Candidatus Endoriftia persephone]|jgi:agmatine/peptidylarginine deiminase|uniref:Agmatine deiminase n=3 Tax=Gammaproteobacteria TaxID=1236 RepID=G2FFE2_9GAMM|nr:agmatine deiminase family protein [Candidatus Endoriftia persephone]EGV52148.1 putative agmatine deiminase [endosymbiont of Riftia pachyptila (vent Ph05)]EGW54520.1 agmatine deiminase [endosymbiont of Tevnia jerichonana (vent Tica)]USF88960.1 agmatine deiminase family protein [Candidatus Endoriftia persephone]